MEKRIRKIKTRAKREGGNIIRSKKPTQARKHTQRNMEKLEAVKEMLMHQL